MENQSGALIKLPREHDNTLQKGSSIGPSHHFWPLDAHNLKTRYDVTWFFQHIFSFSSLRIFYVKMATSEGGVCIFLVGKQPLNLALIMMSTGVSLLNGREEKFKSGICVHTEKSFLNLVKSTRNQIVFTIFRLIWIQMDFRMDPNQSENGILRNASI